MLRPLSAGDRGSFIAMVAGALFVSDIAWPLKPSPPRREPVEGDARRRSADEALLSRCEVIKEGNKLAELKLVLERP